MSDIYSEILSALQREEHVVLATIIQTSGSTPAAALSKMLVTGAGSHLFGTVGGGCVEGDVLHAAKQLYLSGKAAIMRFHLNEDHPESGMLCGGTLDVLIEPLTKENLTIIERLQSIRDSGEDCILATVLASDMHVVEKFILKNTPDESSQSLFKLAPELTPDIIHKTQRRQETIRFVSSQGEVILEPIVGTPQLLIFGGGHVSKYVSRAASMAGFRVTVIDDRKEFANPERFPEAFGTLAVEFNDAFEHVKVTPSTYIVIVTRGHRSDEDVLRNAINTPSKYIGMIGSRKKVLATYEHLVEAGVPVEKLHRVHAPIGLDVGAVTAEEIGVSIVAELIHVRRGGQVPIELKSDAMNSLFGKLQRG
ncbi:MAG: XdhC family protein [Bacteroidota bacterium]